ncbi:hypothetical protein CSC71_14555 [Pseudoxanthomonas sangjuensis]|uniref:tautomerase family protein n=1 Tax=Pseudoxanthomonas sangjuensis TaxID=1503750 RepID=UPI001391E431|nr:tautomerase family protein [Pseudoxanthomonas sangjuensis]KAF1706238.1 hypothetical protein CSC71_14555 [Pseudoxanthomonas sangjuensis]
MPYVNIKITKEGASSDQKAELIAGVTELLMKRLLAALLILPLAGCVVVPVGSGKAGGDTALVCHKGRKTMELPRSAVQGHLNHGDRLGPC